MAKLASYQKNVLLFVQIQAELGDVCDPKESYDPYFEDKLSFHLVSLIFWSLNKLFCDLARLEKIMLFKC